MEEKPDDCMTCDYCGKELPNYAWVDISKDDERTHCEACAGGTVLTRTILMRGFKTRAGYVQYLFQRWLAAESEELSDE